MFKSSIKNLNNNCSRRKCGGKASNLSLLMRWGYCVPQGFCIPVSAWRHFLQQNEIASTVEALQKALAADKEFANLAESILEGIGKGTLPPSLKAELAKNISVFSGKTLAVRSSAISEDSESQSFAGMLETVLNVRAETAAVEKALRTVWSSIFQERILQYISGNRGREFRFDLGVIVQEMLFPQKSGVAFSIHPVSHDPEVIYIEITSSGNDDLVGGKVTPESHAIFKPGIIGRAMEPAWKTDLCRQIMDLEKKMGNPVDIEWALVDNKIYLLQIRPVTAGRDVTMTVWTDENVGEVLPEVATPLTWSILGTMTNSSFEWILNRLGLSFPQGEKFFRLIHGKAYFNHSLFNHSLEKIFGGGSKPVSAVREFFKRVNGLLFKKLPFLLRFAWMCVWLPFRSKFALKTNSSGKSGNLETAQIGNRIQDLIRSESNLMRLHVANTFMGEITYQILVGISNRLKPAEDAAPPHDWIAGIGETASAGSGVALQNIAEEIFRQIRNTATDPKQPEQILSLLKNDPKLQRIVQEFLSKHGHMSDQEFELSHPRWAEQPELLYDILSNIILNYNDEGNAGFSEKIPETEADAPDKTLPGSVLKQLIRLSKKFNRNRENLKQGFIRDHYRLKQLLLQKARSFREHDLLPSEDSIYFLTLAEIGQLSMLKSRTDGQYFHDLIAQRRNEYQAHQELEHPGRWLEAGGEFFAADLSDYPEEDMLHGIPCSGGHAEGTARVLDSFEDGKGMRRGEILVVRSANPGWTPLFLLAKGIICEIGGALSHSAIIAREYGIPMVAAVKNITSLVKTGDRIKINGTTGQVELVNAVEVPQGAKVTSPPSE